ncbi:hypothetical protein NF212_10105 [Parasalinivibrio latis]|uniref:hypothetical protein n=1 Tax=Parasalinivibrio latis TaxID=2952610 RepID=UPI0030E3CE3F
MSSDYDYGTVVEESPSTRTRSKNSRSNSVSEKQRKAHEARRRIELLNELKEAGLTEDEFYS